MALYSSLFSDPEVADLLSDRATIQAMLDVEAALAEAEAAAGMIPAGAARTIRAVARVENIDFTALAAEAANAGNLAIPLVRQLRQRVRDAESGAAEYVHTGTTSQDVIDTALVRQLRLVIPILIGHTERAADAAADLAQRYRRTPMAGRTWLQQATPITFGLKAAGWFRSLTSGASAVHERAQSSLVLQFGGASGTLAALGEYGPAVRRVLAERLQLSPAPPWHSHRDGLVRLSCAVAVLAGSLGKIAKDIALLSQTEIGEVSEPSEQDRGRSSAMPHKHNPVGSAVALTAALRVPGLLATLLAALPHEHERGLGGWQAEWETVPELMRLTSASARSMADVLEKLEVNEPRIVENLAMTGGLILSESLVVRLGRRVGPHTARTIVDGISARAAAARQSLLEAASADTRVTDVIPPAELRDLLSPAHYIGMADTLIDEMLSGWRRRDRSHG
jgi:3-carboxy-cis,cis-muconate cycloisomerase